MDSVNTRLLKIPKTMPSAIDSCLLHKGKRFPMFLTCLTTRTCVLGWTHTLITATTIDWLASTTVHARVALTCISELTPTARVPRWTCTSKTTILIRTCALIHARLRCTWITYHHHHHHQKYSLSMSLIYALNTHDPRSVGPCSLADTDRWIRRYRWRHTKHHSNRGCRHMGRLVGHARGVRVRLWMDAENLRVEQSKPEYPDGQMHWKLVASTAWQVAPFLQGWLAHGSIPPQRERDTLEKNRASDD